MTMSIQSEKRAIDVFIEDLRGRLHKKAEEGFVGWDYMHDGLNERGDFKEPMATSSVLRGRLVRSLENDKFIDVAAFAAMLWNRQVRDFNSLQDKV